MSGQRLPMGTHGEITVMDLPDGRVEVRTRYRDFDGKARLVSARATTKSAAAALKKRLAQRNLYQPVDTTLTLDSLFGELVDYWLYIRRNEHVNPLTAELLDAAFATESQDDERGPA